MNSHEVKEHHDQFIVVKSWHTLLVVILMIAGIIVNYVMVRDQTNQNTTDIKELKERPVVPRDTYLLGQQNIEQRLDRIERKIDQADLREVERQSDVVKKK